MGLHPKYLEAFRVAHDKLVYCDGPISSTDRHYIALMVGTFLNFPAISILQQFAQKFHETDFNYNIRKKYRDFSKGLET